MLFIIKGKMCEVDGVYTKGTEDDNTFEVVGYKTGIHNTDDMVCKEYVAISKKLGSLKAKEMLDNCMMEFLEINNNRLNFREVLETDNKTLCLTVNPNRLKEGDLNYVMRHMSDYLYADGRLAKYLIKQRFEIDGDVGFVTIRHNYDAENNSVEYTIGLLGLLKKFNIYKNEEIDNIKKSIKSRAKLYNKVFGLDEIEDLKVTFK